MTIRAKSPNMGRWPPRHEFWQGYQYEDGPKNFVLGRTFAAFDLQTGKLKWSLPEPELIDGRAVCMSGGRIYYCSPGNYLACLDAPAGRQLWKTTDSQIVEAAAEFAQQRRMPRNADAYLAGMAELTEQEAWGLELFNGKAMCSACHPSEPGENGEPPLFTDFTFDNLGVPKNPKNPFYSMDKVFLDDGSPINPEGADWIDPGLGGFLQTRPEWEALAPENMGKHKVTTLRNVDKRPGIGFPKAYMHNGVFKSLKEVVHFYNTRDVEDWPPPEVPENVNTDELGDLGLTLEEEEAIVVFMKTLSDGYVP